MSGEKTPLAHCGGNGQKMFQTVDGSETRAAEWLRGLHAHSRQCNTPSPPPAPPLPLLSILTSTSFTNGRIFGDFSSYRRITGDQSINPQPTFYSSRRNPTDFSARSLSVRRKLRIYLTLVPNRLNPPCPEGSFKFCK